MSEVDFGVSMRDEVLAHKLADGRVHDGRYCYWTFPHGVPKGTATGCAMWVANRGQWIGYFVIHEDVQAENELCFYSESFHRVDGGTRRPFMGFTYKCPGRA